MMRTLFCLITICLGVLHQAFAQQNPNANPSPFPPGSPMGIQQARMYQDFTRTQQKFYQAKVDSILALKNSYPRLSTTRKASVSRYLGNGCGLHADCTPEQDTTVVTGYVTLKNTTIGADSYEWIDDSWSSFPKPNEDLVMYPPVGVAHVRLIAHKGNCTDTADRYIVVNGTPPASNANNMAAYGQPGINNVVQCVATDPTDGYLLAGTSGGDPWGDNAGNPYFVRVTENGCILWSRLINSFTSRIVSVLPMPGGGFVALAGDNRRNVSGTIDRFDANGNILWTKSIAGTYWLGMKRDEAVIRRRVFDHGTNGAFSLWTDECRETRCDRKFCLAASVCLRSGRLGVFLRRQSKAGAIFMPLAGMLRGLLIPSQYPYYLEKDYGVLAKIDLGYRKYGLVENLSEPREILVSYPD